MSEYIISSVSPDDSRATKQINSLLESEGIRRDTNLDYTCGMYDDEMNIIATGSCFGNTLRCMAVSSLHQGEGLMNQIVTHLVNVQFERGNSHLFLYTKCDSAKFFGDLGFYEIIRINNQIVFMENRRNGFQNYLENLKKETLSSPVIKRFNQECTFPFLELHCAAIVMNANPFTLGHQYLIEKAAAENDIVHLFIVSEDASIIPFSVRKNLVMDGTAHLNNIIYHESGPYIISNATFPSYFQKDSLAVMESHANLDLAVFIQLAKALGINRRYVGEEPNSQVTKIYNDTMSENLPKNNIACCIVPRKEADGIVISASTVRTALKENRFELLKKLVPQTTLSYFQCDEAQSIMAKIHTSENLIHH